MPVLRFKRETIAPGWQRITIERPMPINPGPDSESVNEEAKLRIVRFVLATASGIVGAAGFGNVSGVISAAADHILSALEVDAIEDEESKRDASN